MQEDKNLTEEVQKYRFLYNELKGIKKKTEK